jgi:hypothetical protein
VLALAWHPASSVFLALAGGGRIYVWTRVFEENWSAFAPDFKVGAAEAGAEVVPAPRRGLPKRRGRRPVMGGTSG